MEVFDEAAVRAATDRLSAAGRADRIETEETCCYATQDKAWSHEPQGVRWEWYRITDDDPIEKRPAARVQQEDGRDHAQGVCCT